MILSSVGTIDSFDDKLILLYDASDPNSYPFSGTQITDLSPYSNDGTLNGTVYSPALPGSFLSDGSNDYISVPSNFITWDGGQPITIMMWFRGTSQGIILGQQGSEIPNTLTNGYVPAVYVDSNNNLRISVFWHGGANLSYDTGLNVTDGVWRQLTVTYDGISESIYINGSLINERVVPQVNYHSTYYYFLGTGSLAGWSLPPTNSYWTGEINLVKAYQRALSPIEITTQYDETVGRYNDITVIETFTSVGSTSWVAPAGVQVVECLVVGGGGGGGNGYDNAGGGGGGGGMVLAGTLTVVPGRSYTVTVGAGGLGGANARDNNAGLPGNNSAFGSITAFGGGNGLGSRTGGIAGVAQIGNISSATGGSGSGGGNGGKGGGGASGAGTANSGSTGGAGGTGISSSIGGSAVFYGIGGAGANAGTQNAGVNGLSNRGNGGRAGGAGTANSTGGGNGGSGIVIIKYATSVVNDNLVINLDAGNISSYPGSGTVWTNLVDSSNYTISNGSFDSADGGSIVFNGTSTFVPIGSPLSSGTHYTMEAWVRADIVTGARNVLSSSNNVFWNNGSTLSGGVGGSFSLVTSSSFPANAWRHVVLTFNDATNTMRLYINGTQVSQNLSVTQSYVSETLRIGSHFGVSPISFWDGKIAQVRVYDTDLSAAGVLNNFNATRSRYGL
jgi:hypothetical protein